MDRFIRSENVKHYKALLVRMTDERKNVEKLLAAEQQKQIEADDFAIDSKYRPLVARI